MRASRRARRRRNAACTGSGRSHWRRWTRGSAGIAACGRRRSTRSAPNSTAAGGPLRTRGTTRKDRNDEFAGRAAPGRRLPGGAVRAAYPATPAEVWNAVTQPERITRWLAPTTLPDDGCFMIDFGNGQQTTGEVVSCEPPRALAVTWD